MRKGYYFLLYISYHYSSPMIALLKYNVILSRTNYLMFKNNGDPSLYRQYTATLIFINVSLV